MKFESNGLISLEINGKIYDYKLYQSLDSLSRTNSQRKSAKELGISHTVFNRRLLKAEDKLGVKITQKVGNGTLLTPEGESLLDEFRKYIIQIEKTPDINIVGGHISTGLLDDPLIAYERDINFIPIAYDYLVLVSSQNSKNIDSISDLEGLDFVNVQGSAQRLAWTSLKHYDIEYNIKENVNSQFDAFKLVRNSENLYTFLNASYFKGNELLKYDTQHVISIVKVNDDKEEVNEFVRFLLNEGQELIEKQGFTPMG